MKKCTECEYFKILYPPIPMYDSGRAECKKHDLVVDYNSTQKLNKLGCVEEEVKE